MMPVRYFFFIIVIGDVSHVISREYPFLVFTGLDMGERIPDSRKAIRKRMEWSGHRERETNVGKEIREVIRSYS